VPTELCHGRCIGISLGSLVGPEFRRVPGVCRAGCWWTLALTLRHPTHSQGTSERGRVWYVSYLVFMVHRYRISPFSSPPQKLLSKSSSRGLKYLERHYWRPADKLQKVCLHVVFHVGATGWLMAHLLCRCKTPTTGRNWRGRGCWERDDGLCHGQADARASNDVG
jgi:hypothetical protein